MTESSLEVCERLSSKLMTIVREENPEYYELLVATASMMAFAGDALGMSREEFIQYSGRVFDVNQQEKMKELQ